LRPNQAPRLRLIINPFLALATARRGYQIAIAGRIFDPDSQREQRIAVARARLVTARAMLWAAVAGRRA
jgi:hypothetical protein